MEEILDIAHVAFLDVIRALIGQVGATSTKGTLLRMAVKAGEKMPPVDFPTFADFISAIDTAANPITQIEGRAVHVGDGVFGLPKCPFAQSINNYKAVFGGLPDCYAEVTADYNKPGPATADLRVGHGAGVSPFCSIHQPMRSAVSRQITIGGKPITVYQLGCKSGSGVKGLADTLIASGGWSREVVDKVLDSNMCCYGIRVAA